MATYFIMASLLDTDVCKTWMDGDWLEMKEKMDGKKLNGGEETFGIPFHFSPQEKKKQKKIKEEDMRMMGTWGKGTTSH